MAKIYAFYSGRNGKVRYVGQTLLGHQERFGRHQRRESDGSSTAIYRWIHREWKAGFPVNAILLQTCADDQRHKLETEWPDRIARWDNSAISSPALHSTIAAVGHYDGASDVGRQIRGEEDCRTNDVLRPAASITSRHKALVSAIDR
jgi:hypothetical protein